MTTTNVLIKKWSYRSTTQYTTYENHSDDMNVLLKICDHLNAIAKIKEEGGIDVSYQVVTIKK